MHLNFQTPDKWTCCSNADFKALYDAGQADCLADCTVSVTTPTPTGPTTTKGPAPDCKKADGPSGTVKSPGYPDVSSDMDESCWKIKCDDGNKMLYVNSEVAYKLDYNCGEDGESSSEECEDIWSSKKCKKKCNAKKCKKDKKCKKSCKNTCGLCDDRILAPFY